MLEYRHNFIYDWPNRVSVLYRLDASKENKIVVRVFTEPYDQVELIIFPGSQPKWFEGTNDGLLEALIYGNRVYEQIVASLLRRCKGEPNKPQKFENQETLYQENIRVIIEKGSQNLPTVMQLDDFKNAVANNYAIDLSAIPKEVVRKEW